MNPSWIERISLGQSKVKDHVKGRAKGGGRKTLILLTQKNDFEAVDNSCSFKVQLDIRMSQARADLGFMVKTLGFRTSGCKLVIFLDLEP